MQSRAIRKLREYLAEEATAYSANLDHFADELAMADELFQAAQAVFANFPTSDSQLRKVQAGLLTGCIRYYASAVDLCLRGNGVEAQSLMRTPIESMGYLVLLTEKPALVPHWVHMDELKASDRRKLFGTETQHRAHKLMRKTAETFEAFSIFGTHARVQMIAHTMAQLPTGWTLHHAEINANHVRIAFVAVLFTMRDLVYESMVPLLLEEPLPSELQAHRNKFEELRQGYGTRHPEFMQWVPNASIDHKYAGTVRPVRRASVVRQKTRREGK